MNNVLRYCIGIDVDKKEFKTHMLSIDSQGVRKSVGSRTFLNSKKGFPEFVAWINKHQKITSASLTITMEATGIYHENLAWYCYRKGFKVNIVLPLRAKRYFQSLGQRSKNDQLDAKGLATMGLEQQLDIWQPADIDLIGLRSLTRQYESIQEVKTEISNQLEAATFSAVSDPQVSKSLKAIISTLETELKKIEKQIHKTVNENPVLSHKWSLMEAVKGLGILTFAVIVAETGGFALFTNIKQLTKYAGYDIIENQSGPRVGKTKISKKGNAHIRRAMHMASLSTIRFEKGSFKNLYERVFERTKIKMKGYVAVQRKLLCLMYTLWKTDNAYVPKTKDEHSIEKEAEAPLSGEAPLGAKNQDIKVFEEQASTKKSSPALHGATLDELSGEFSTVSPLSGKAKILEKSYS